MVKKLVPHSTKGDKKQVVFIMTDTTRKDMLGCYGNHDMITPNLDRLASQGVRYDNAYSCQPVCGPARSAIFSGLAPHSNGVQSNGLAYGQNVKTIGQWLQHFKIKTGYIGKWHLDAGDYFGYGVCPDGWDSKYWYDMKCYLDEKKSDKDRVRSRNPMTSFDDDISPEFTYAHGVTIRALSYLDEHQDDEFLLVVSYDEPHGPCITPKPWNQMYKDFKWPSDIPFSDSLENKPFLQKLWAKGDLHKEASEINKPSQMLSLFLSCNSFVDNEIGKVIAKVEEVCPDAMIIYTSDHGDMLGSHKLQMKNATCYKEVANIPLIIKKPGGAVNVVTDEMASHIDLSPTIMDYFGLPIPKIMEGKSMLKNIENPQEPLNEAVFTEWTRYEVDHDGFGGMQLMRGATSKRYKLVINLCDTDEFYDLEKDPYEINNLINDPSYVSERNHLHDLLLKNMNDTRDTFRGYQWACRPWRTDKIPCWENDGYTRQRDNGDYEPRQLDYDTGLPYEESVRKKVTKDEKN